MMITAGTTAPSTTTQLAEEHFDVITIGSGIGSLATSALLATVAGKRVLVLERHDRLGGFTHTFTRRGYTWDIGLHYVGQMDGGLGRKLMDLVTGHAVTWDQVPSPFERFSYPDLEFRQPDDPAAFQAALTAQFPHQAAALERYFADIERVGRWGTRLVMSNLVPRAVGRLLLGPGRRLALQTTGDYLDAHFTDERLKALLASQWGDYGLPPSQSAFVVHATIVGHYLRGACYPRVAPASSRRVPAR